MNDKAVPICCVTFIFSEYIVRVTLAANPSFHENMNQTFTFYFSTLKDIYLYQCVGINCVPVFISACVCRDQKSPSGDLYHSLRIPLRQNLSLNLGLIFSQLGQKPVSPSNPSFSAYLCIKLP